VCSLDGGDGLVVIEDERLVWRRGDGDRGARRHVTASSNQNFSTKVAGFTRPSSVVREGTNDRRTWRQGFANVGATL